MANLKRRIKDISETVSQEMDDYKYIYEIMAIKLNDNVIQEMEVNKINEHSGQIEELDLTGFLIDIKSEKETYNIGIYNQGISDNDKFVEKNKEELKALYRLLIKNVGLEAINKG